MIMVKRYYNLQKENLEEEEKKREKNKIRGQMMDGQRKIHFSLNIYVECSKSVYN